MAAGPISYSLDAPLADSREPVSSDPRAVKKRVAEDELRSLMLRYQAGDSEAVDELIRQISPQLLRFMRGVHLQQSEAEDLLQDCWIRIHRARHTYRQTEPLLPWIYAIARHTRLDAYRKRRRVTVKEVLVADVPERSDATRARSDVMALLDRLPEAQREALVLLKVVGLSLEEVAQATASTVGAVKQRAHRAYVTLREMLEVANERG